MPHKINILPKARADIAQAVRWYEDKRLGLGARFEVELWKKLEIIAEYPKIHTQMHPLFRRAVMYNFPYIILYRERSDTLDVVAVFATKMDPHYLESRLE